jgi:hypothetical protein
VPRVTHAYACAPFGYPLQPPFPSSRRARGGAGCGLLWRRDAGRRWEERRVDGAFARLELVCATGRVRLDAIDTRGVPYGLGERAPVRDVPAQWIERARRWSVDEWAVTWVPPGTQARASGKVTALEGDGYRDAPRGRRIGPSDEEKKEKARWRPVRPAPARAPLRRLLGVEARASLNFLLYGHRLIRDLAVAGKEIEECHE